MRDRLPAWVPRDRNAVILVAAMLVGTFGTGMFLAGSAIFFTTTGGLTEIEFGTGLAVASVAGLAAAVPISSVADWAGPKRVLVIVYLWRSVWFAVLAFTSGPFGFAAAASRPGRRPAVLHPDPAGAHRSRCCGCPTTPASPPRTPSRA
ncbi:hypothetical protein [Streptomonospora salina]|uniref:Major facilitator superfamily (MFS) profile domain-containing protein n=1 Tax=Streptomonospora salina TaxID=104205 RepID=A0A841E5V4_9ACTN|nr:hypothetical protein [Streptomonospora salina]MBB5998525.1 hypothetical protein [Streptomonospora salina]